jgi:hypothetical protein
MRNASYSTLMNRLAAWEREKRTNRCGLAYAADLAIANIRATLDRFFKRTPPQNGEQS